MDPPVPPPPLKGLKTALFHVAIENEIGFKLLWKLISRKDRRVLQVGPAHQLGWAPAGDPDVAAWLRTAVPTLDAESAAGWGFGLCYAEPAKLWEARAVPAGAETKTIQELFDLEQLEDEWDGDAHYRAACYGRCAELTANSINIALGTGFAVAGYVCVYEWSMCVHTGPPLAVQRACVRLGSGRMVGRPTAAHLLRNPGSGVSTHSVTTCKQCVARGGIHSITTHTQCVALCCVTVGWHPA